MGTQIRLFNGEGVDEWISQVKEYFKINSFQREGSNVLYASFFLIESAREWWNDWRFIKRECYTVEEFLQAIHLRFEADAPDIHPAESTVLNDQESPLLDLLDAQIELDISKITGVENDRSKEDHDNKFRVQELGDVELKNTKKDEEREIFDFIQVFEAETVFAETEEKIKSSCATLPIQKKSVMKTARVLIQDPGYFNLIVSGQLLFHSWDHLSIDRLSGDINFVIWDPGGENCCPLIVLGWLLEKMKAQYEHFIFAPRVFDKLFEWYQIDHGINFTSATGTLIPIGGNLIGEERYCAHKDRPYLCVILINFANNLLLPTSLNGHDNTGLPIPRHIFGFCADKDVLNFRNFQGYIFHFD